MKQLCNHHCTCLIRAAPSWRQTLATHIQLGLLRSNTISNQQTHLHTNISKLHGKAFYRFRLYQSQVPQNLNGDESFRYDTGRKGIRAGSVKLLVATEGEEGKKAQKVRQTVERGAVATTFRSLAAVAVVAAAAENGRKDRKGGSERKRKGRFCSAL